MKKMHRPLLRLLAAGLVVWAAGCSRSHEHAEEVEGDSWAVTAWGDRFEIFAETDGLEVGATSIAFTHVTVLDGFAALTEGTVSVVLLGAGGGETVFSIDRMTRPGIFSVQGGPHIGVSLTDPISIVWVGAPAA